MTRPRSDAPPALAARSQGWGRTVFEIPQARRRTRRRSLREVLSHHLSARWQIYALLVFLLVVGGVLLWAYTTFPPPPKG